MNVGQLRTLIYIQQYSSTVDESGDTTPTWSTVYTTWAKKRTKRGNINIIDEQRTAISYINFIIRKLKGIDESCRILCNDEYFRITGINEIVENEYLEIETEKYSKEIVF